MTSRAIPSWPGTPHREGFIAALRMRDILDAVLKGCQNASLFGSVAA
jgi:hypothetical protein